VVRSDIALGKIQRKLRKERGLSQVQLAESVPGVDRVAISKIENGRIGELGGFGGADLASLCQALNIPFKDLENMMEHPCLEDLNAYIKRRHDEEPEFALLVGAFVAMADKRPDLLKRLAAVNNLPKVALSFGLSTTSLAQGWIAELERFIGMTELRWRDHSDE